MKPKQYIGITGPASKQEVRSLLTRYENAGYSMQSEHTPMIGYLVSQKTLTEMPSNPSNNKRYPGINEVIDLLAISHGKAFNMIHFHTKEKETLAHQVYYMFKVPLLPAYELGLCRAMQLNIRWPPVKQVELIKKDFPKMSLVFQANQGAMQDLSPKEFTSRLKDYRESIDYVLIDPSGGKGELFNIDHSVSMYSDLSEQLPDVTIGFAGGLSGENVKDIVSNLMKKTGTSDFCIDAEGGLRDKLSDAWGDDVLNMDKVRDYLQGASKVLR